MTSRKPNKRRVRRRLDVDVRREELLKAGLRFFGERPYDTASLDDLAKRVGASKALLYHYFPSKRDYYVETLKYAADELIADAKPDSALAPEERLTATLDAFLAAVEKSPAGHVALFRGGIGSDREVAQVVDRTREVFYGWMVEGLGVTPSAWLRLAIRGWFGFVETISLEWALTKTGTRASIRDLALSTLRAVLQETGWTPPEPPP